jgi:hypothetical protein
LLVVDDFGIKCVGIEHAEQLEACIEKHFEISCDWTAALIVGSNYIGIMKRRVLTYPCQDKSRQLFTSSNVQIQCALKMHHIYGTRQCMEKNPSSLRLKKKTFFVHQKI